MADNFTVRDGSGSLITIRATDLGSSVYAPHHRHGDGSGNLTPAMDAVGRAGFVKVTDGTNTMPTGDATARAVHVQAGGDLIDVTCTLDTSAYTSGDVLFDTQAVTDAVRANGGQAILDSVTVIDEDDQGIAFTLYILRAANSLGTENSAPNISDANARDILGWVPVASGDYSDVGGAKVATVRNIGLFVEATGSTRDLYVGGVTGGTPTHSASGLKLRLGFRWL